MIEADHAPGIYFGMPEDEYRADPSLSASGIKRLLVSPLDYWVTSWMNPEYVERETPAKKLGKAYHKLILEGREAFERAYAVMPSKDDYPDALDGADALREYCRDLGLKVSGTIAEMCARIREHDAAVQLWPEIKAHAEREATGRTKLTFAQWQEIECAALVISRMPSVAQAFQGGYSEVSLFWVDGSGVPMKARIDYLKPKTIVDLKTFANIMDKDLRAAVANEIARNSYHVQAVAYVEGLKQIKAMYREHGMDIVYGGADPAWIKQTLTEPRTRFVFVFQQTGDVPNCIAREFAEFETWGGNGATRNAYWLSGTMAYRRGIEIFRKALDHYGTDVPWVADHGLSALRDIDFPMWLLNATNEEAA